MVATALQRKDVYGLLRWGFFPYHAHAWHVVRSPEWYDRLEQAMTARSIPQAVPPVRSMKIAMSRFASVEDWRSESNLLFERSGSLTLNGTDYTSGHAFQQAAQLADLRGFYRAFNHVPAPAAAERADHLGIQTEFLFLLAHLEEKASEADNRESVATTREATFKFLEAHTGRVPEEIARRLGETCPEAFATNLVRATACAVAADAGDFGARPSALPPASRNASEGSEFNCGECPT